MKKSQLKQLIRETMEEMASSSKKPLPSTRRKQKAAAKPYSLKPSPDPIMDDEMELRVKGKLLALIWPLPEDSAETVGYMLFPSENEYETDGTVESVAKWIYKSYG